LPGRDEPIKAVRDFFHFQFGGTPDHPALDWAIFNVADICLVSGAVMLMIQSFLTEPEITAGTTTASPTEP
ncbi:MAG: signal peptidase II, partial [Fuerstiella sp.]|nr:signal peptidase II [Fuerstiella sp.]